MAVRPVLRVPHPALKQIAEATAGRDVGKVEADLLETMRAHAGCVGLAAPQIGELVRVIIVDARGHKKATTSNGLLVLRDPVLVHAEGDDLGREGCLSVPDLTANVRRATSIVVETASARIVARDFEARALLHELDHLDGILFLDRVASRSDVFARKRYA
jgi:peptide deformylase